MRLRTSLSALAKGLGRGERYLQTAEHTLIPVRRVETEDGRFITMDRVSLNGKPVALSLTEDEARAVAAEVAKWDQTGD